MPKTIHAQNQRARRLLARLSKRPKVSRSLVRCRRKQINQQPASTPVYIWHESQKVPASLYCEAHAITPEFIVVKKYVEPARGGFYYHFS